MFTIQYEWDPGVKEYKTFDCVIEASYFFFAVEEWFDVISLFDETTGEIIAYRDDGVHTLKGVA